MANAPQRTIDSIPIFALASDRDRPAEDGYGIPVGGWTEGDMSYVLETRTLEIFLDGSWEGTGHGSGGSAALQGWAVALYTEDAAGLGSTWDAGEETWTNAGISAYPLGTPICSIEGGDPEDAKSGVFRHEGDGVYRRSHEFTILDTCKLVLVSGGPAAGLMVLLYDAGDNTLTRGTVFDPNA